MRSAPGGSDHLLRTIAVNIASNAARSAIIAMLSVGTGTGATAGRTVTSDVDELSPGFASTCGATETVAVLLIGPETVGVTTSVMVAFAPGRIAPRLQVTVVVPVQFP
jgi:hypothetical protein